MSRIWGLPAGRTVLEISLWSADAARFADEVARSAPHADMFHIDASDGHMAPLLLFSPDLVARLRRLTDVSFHVHLMATNDILLRQVDLFAEAGADLITVHVENGDMAPAALAHIRRAGLACGIALGLDTPVEAAAPLLPAVDLVTLVGTRIGLKGQDLDPRAPGRLRAMRRLLAEAGESGRVIVAADGGIREHTAPLLRAAGADALVLGSLAFGASDMAAAAAWARGLPGYQGHGEEGEP